MNDADHEVFQALYGRWAPLAPAEVATLLDRSGSAGSAGPDAGGPGQAAG